MKRSTNKEIVLILLSALICFSSYVNSVPVSMDECKVELSRRLRISVERLEAIMYCITERNQCPDNEVKYKMNAAIGYYGDSPPTYQ